MPEMGFIVWGYCYSGITMHEKCECPRSPRPTPTATDLNNSVGHRSES